MSNDLALRVAAKAVIKADDGILVLHPSEIDLNRKWHIPGGIRDDIAEPILQTAMREMKEETGIVLDRVPSKVFKIGEWQAVDKGEKVKILAVFFQFTLTSRPDIKLSHEHDNFAWLDISNYKQYEANPEVYEIIEEILTKN
jgi:8-oxo-dGTP pyrophosphatase MutT (NUDIX family)